ncbi:MAG: M56 family metallopeptidase [Candidatus Krumholzibacteria bacterium]|nr:M56 family metallopeptidase [Candidatus Krumholzibacteria bacterium]
MNAGMGVWLAAVPWAGFLGLVLEISLKAAVVCAFAGTAALSMRRSSAHARSMVWVFTLAVLLVLPLSHLVSPLWNLPVIPTVESWFARGAGGGAPVALSDKALDAQDALGSAASGTAAGAGGAAGLAEGWQAWAFLVWAAGTALSLLWLFARTALGGRILGRCEAVDGEWNELVRETSAGLGLTRRVRLYESDEIGTAVTVGAINPAIVVPAGSSEWPAERRRYILSHELAHVKRWDGLIEVLVLVAQSIYWFNPLVWLVVRSLRVERERDCDDAVLNAGARPSDYAMFLMDIAADLGASRRPVWQLSTLSQGSNLKERIMCILDPKIDRNRGKRRAGIVTCLLLGSIIIPLSISGIWQTQAQEQETKSEKAKKEQAKAKEAELKAKQAELQAKQSELQTKEEELKAQQTDLESKKVMLKKKAMENMTDEEKAKLKEEMALKEKMSKMSPEERIRFTWQKISTQDKSAAVLVHDTILKKGPEAGIKAAMTLKESDDGNYYFKEGEFNTLGYLFLFDNKVDEALAAFKLNVKMYPESWNVYDSLGEGLIAAGKYDDAKKYYEKSIELNADNENGKNMLAKIEEHEKTGEPIATTK